MEIKAIIANINRLFDANCYTDNRRIVLDYCENTDIVLVKVMDKIETFSCEDLTAEGILFKSLNVAQRMWGISFDL